VDDAIESLLDLAPFHAENGAVQEDVLPSREFRTETSTDIEEGTDATPRAGDSFGRARDSAQHLEQRRLARAVVTDDSERLALLDAEADITECPQLLSRLRLLPHPES